MITLYNVISQDGFIADKDGSEDFIPDNSWQYFLDLCTEYGALIIGRNTYQTIQQYDRNLLQPLENLPIKKIIVTSDLGFSANQELGYVIVHSPEEAIAIAPNALVSSGPMLNNYFLVMHLVKKIILKVIPVNLGEGIKPFDSDSGGRVPITYIR
jgi:dihydrofolate reductase